MTEFWNTNQQAIVYALIVIVVVLALRPLTKKFHDLMERRWRRKHPGEEPSTINLTQKIMNALWIVLGIMALSFIFIDRKQYRVATENFYLVLYLGIVAVATLVVASLVQTWFKRSIAEKIRGQQDPTSYKFLRYLSIFGVYFVGALLAILAFPALRGIAQTALGGAGVLAVVAGVASQEALANLVGGVFIISFKPFKIGDIIKIDSTMVGTVTDITLRHTVIKNYENKMIVIPNSVINKEKLINYALGERMCCEWIEIGISYGSDIDLAKHIMREECEDHPNIMDHRSELDIYNSEKKVMVRVIRLDDSAVTIRAWAWSASFTDAFILKCDVLESVKKRFDKEGIEIPFPHRTLVLKKERSNQVTKVNANIHI